MKAPLRKMSYAFHKMNEALQHTPESPCDKFKCPHKKRCATELEACSMFARYVDTGRVIPELTREARLQMIPSKKLYWRLYKDEK